MRAGALPSPLRGGVGGGGRDASGTGKKNMKSWRQDPTEQPSETRRARARSLRRRLTGSEKRLWWHSRHRLPVEGTHLRRQVPIGSYVADFCCLSQRLIVEVDGDQHGSDVSRHHDEHRTRFLEAQGYRVLRFSNRDVMTATDVVLDTVLAALGPTTPTPNPSPQGGGEKQRTL